MTQGIICPQCGYANPANSKFCGQCGAALVPGSQPAGQAVPIWRRLLVPAIAMAAVALLAVCLLLFVLLRQQRGGEQPLPPPATSEATFEDPLQDLVVSDMTEDQAETIANGLVKDMYPELADPAPLVQKQEVDGRTMYSITYAQDQPAGDTSFRQIVNVTIDTRSGEVSVFETD